MNTNTPLPYRLRIPGPIAVPKRIQQAIANQVLNHRGHEFIAIVQATAALAQPVFGTKNQIMFFASSGTGVMEAAMINALGTGDRALIIAGGQFGERFVEIAKAHNIEADVIKVPWGEAVSMEEVETRLQQGDFQAVVAVHNESSTGTVGDIEALGRIVAKTNAILIVDSVSGLGAVKMRQDEWGVDILVSASQKALMCPPGLGLMSVSAKGWQHIEKENGKSRYYWDLRKARESANKDQTAFTPPVTLMSGLREALTMINAEGMENIYRRQKRVADGLRAGGKALGMPVFTTSPLVSDAVTVFTMPDGLDGNAVVRHMHDEFNTVIAGARNWLAGKVIRIGTMGQLTDKDILTDLEYLEATLKHLNFPVKEGAARRAALEVFGQKADQT